jgi:hypothetical protein
MVAKSFPGKQDLTENFDQKFFGCKTISSKTGSYKTFSSKIFWSNIYYCYKIISMEIGLNQKLSSKVFG